MAKHYDAVIIGAGFGEIGAAIQLKRLGYDNLLMLEREASVPGRVRNLDLSRSRLGGREPPVATGEGDVDAEHLPAPPDRHGGHRAPRRRRSSGRLQIPTTRGHGAHARIAVTCSELAARKHHRAGFAAIRARLDPRTGPRP